MEIIYIMGSFAVLASLVALFLTMRHTQQVQVIDHLIEEIHQDPVQPEITQELHAAKPMPVEEPKPIIIDLKDHDQHDRVIVMFTDPSDEDRQIGVSILWLIHNGSPFNAATGAELEYESTCLVH